MIIKEIGKRKDGTARLTLEPEAPFAWVCNKDVTTFSTSVFLGRTDSVDNWRDATETEHEEWLRSQEEPEEEATDEDYLNALAEMGVNVDD